MQEMLNKIICGDCIEILNNIESPFADLVFADPPFNIGYKYDKYYDKEKSKNYIRRRHILESVESIYVAR